MLQMLIAALRYVPLPSWAVLKWFAAFATLAQSVIRRWPLAALQYVLLHIGAILKWFAWFACFAIQAQRKSGEDRWLLNALRAFQAALHALRRIRGLNVA